MCPLQRGESRALQPGSHDPPAWDIPNERLPQPCEPYQCSHIAGLVLSVRPFVGTFSSQHSPPHCSCKLAAARPLCERIQHASLPSIPSSPYALQLRHKHTASICANAEPCGIWLSLAANMICLLFVHFGMCMRQISKPSMTPHHRQRDIKFMQVSLKYTPVHWGLTCGIVACRRHWQRARCCRHLVSDCSLERRRQ